MKKGLVLEGGGLRALFTAGVTDVMMENGIRFDGLIGVSAGATFGCNYKSEQPGRALRYNINFKDDPRYMSWRSFLKTGDLVGAEFSYHVLPNQLDIFDYETFRRNPMEFHVVCTDAETGEPVYKQLDDMTDEGLDWIRASASMPIVSRPVQLEGRKLLDGGIVNSIPLKHFQEIGYERNIVVLTQPKGFFKKRTKLMPLFHLTMRKYPAIIQAMGRRHLMYNEQLRYLAQEERKGNILLIHPDDTLPIGRTEQNEKKMRQVYQMGRAAAEKKLSEITGFLSFMNCEL
ncbi:MAG: patatin family protein [Bacteroidaceae bacterium]|jgi:predicted patatin/cPLA2 family phospholipase|nr:patatin family protein [Bacteroidaceae bacterium]